MSRPVGADPERTRQRLVESASRHFSSHGLAATSLRSVARDAGVSLATINHYFGTKQELHAACMDALYEDLTHAFAPMRALLADLAAEVQLASESETDLGPLLDRLVRTAFRIVIEHRQELHLVMRPWWETGELDARWRHGIFLPFLQAMSQAISVATGRPAAQLRLEVQSLVTIGMRYALTSPQELAEFAGIVPPGTVLDASRAKRTHAAIEDHLVAMARSVLLTPNTAPNAADREPT